MADDVRTSLDALIRDSGEDYSSVSRLLGRNPAYIQQFIKRGTPRRLAEDDRLKLAAYFRVPEERLGGRTRPEAQSPAALTFVPRIEIGASAGPGGIAEIEEHGAPLGMDPALLRDLAVRRPASLSIIRVSGDSMEPTLRDGDDILVDRDVSAPRWGGIHVLRLDDMLVVKRLIRDGRNACVIRSDNMAYPDIRVDDPGTISLIGRVLWCGRRFV
jgi:phage repressor protein C with HTH and peptisase S24 domain